MSHPLPDFTATPEIVRLFVEGERLSYGHLFNPAFATETSRIDALPHQRIAVYSRMLPQPRLRFLLADDAGAGKTIMAGLYIREMLTRRLLRRVIVIPPAGLVGNWRRELNGLFSLLFKIVTGPDARNANPFSGPGSDLVIISVDTLSAGTAFGRLTEPGVEPYDLAIFDEAHKLSARRDPDFTIEKTQRYELAEYLSRACRHLMLLTATPHMGKDYSYFALWQLLEPDVLTTPDAFNNYPPSARARHFIRRIKEEMIDFDGNPLYKKRESQTASYDLSPSEQKLYDATTEYIELYYNKARMLNRSAARLAMSIFQRRLASSTYSLLRSFERRLAKLDYWINEVESGNLTMETLLAQQRKKDAEVEDITDSKTGDEESTEDGKEENEVKEDEAMTGVIASTLAELRAERDRVAELLDLAKLADADPTGSSKFEKLREVLTDERFKNQKILIFTEFRDTLDFMVKRFQALGFTDDIAIIHGGLPFGDREDQIEAFRKGKILVATDAAGEGLNMQFCWLMFNYDIPWNPARIEQRMGRIHRYGQEHDVVLVNLVAGKTREGRVLKTLLEKLEKIRKELRSDKVFDIIGRLFEGVSLKDLIMQSVNDEKADEVCKFIEGTLTPEQAKARQEAMERLYETGGDVKLHLAEEKERLRSQELLRLLPGYVRRFVSKSAPFMGTKVEGDLDGFFHFAPAPEPLIPLLESYEEERRDRFTVHKPKRNDETPCIFLHPGEPFLDRYRDIFCGKFADDALRGAIFVDPLAARPYFFHIALTSARRRSDASFPEAFAQDAVLEQRLVGLRHEPGKPVEQAPVELLMVLQDGKPEASLAGIVVKAAESHATVESFLAEHIARPMAEKHRDDLLASIPEREDFIKRGFDYEESDLAAARTELRKRANAGDRKAVIELSKVKARQQHLSARRQRALAILQREPELIEPGHVEVVARALIVPSADPVALERHNREIELIAVYHARLHEESQGATVEDVSDPLLKRGHDLLSRRPNGDELAIEVKGRRGVGDVELTENEWAKAVNLREKYWLYVVYDCAAAHPRLLRVRDPFGVLLAKAKGGVIIDEKAIFAAAQAES